MAVLRRTLPLAAALASVLWAREARSQDQRFGETEVKAVFLLNFARFVEWPPEVFSDAAAPVMIGVLGNDPFGDILDKAVEGETLGGRSFSVNRFRSLKEIKPCHVLYVSSSGKKDLSRILERLKNAKVLTVGETERFTKMGGMIGFLLEENKVRFEINQNVAEQAGLKISSRLLRLAKGSRTR